MKKKGKGKGKEREFYLTYEYGKSLLTCLLRLHNVKKRRPLIVFCLLNSSSQPTNQPTTSNAKKLLLFSGLQAKHVRYDLSRLVYRCGPFHYSLLLASLLRSFFFFFFSLFYLPFLLSCVARVVCWCCCILLRVFVCIRRSTTVKIKLCPRGVNIIKAVMIPKIKRKRKTYYCYEYYMRKRINM